MDGQSSYYVPLTSRMKMSTEYLVFLSSKSYLKERSFHHQGGRAGPSEVNDVAMDDASAEPVNLKNKTQ